MGFKAAFVWQSVFQCLDGWCLGGGFEAADELLAD